MIVQRNAEKEKLILDAMKASFADEERTGVHLSDLLHYRQSYFRRMFPQPLTEREILYFLAGRGHEEVFARLCGVQVGASKVKHVPIPEFATGDGRLAYGISYRPDFRWYGRPTEFKTRRANLAKEGEETVVYEHYLDQLLGYCALDWEIMAVDAPDHVGLAQLIVFSLLEGRSGDPFNPTHPELAVYDVRFPMGELKFKIDQLLSRRVEWLTAQIEGTPQAGQKLALCAPWLCGTNVKDPAQSMKAWCATCNKEIAHKPGHEHLGGVGDRPAKDVWLYAPRCTQYHICQPQLIDATRGPRSSDAKA